MLAPVSKAVNAGILHSVNEGISYSLVCTSKKHDATMSFEAMVLSDRTIRQEISKGRIVIEPLNQDCIQPASVDLHLDNKLLVFKSQRYPAYIDVRRSLDHLNKLVEIEEEKPFFLNPGEFVLASTLESISLPDDIVGRLEGKSSLGRIGLLIHSTAGYVDPGWQGNLTLELSNVAKLPITLYYRMKIGQISFLRLTAPVERMYGTAELGSKYQGQTEPTASRYHENFVKGT
jgi:dCTP deaminase